MPKKKTTKKSTKTKKTKTKLPRIPIVTVMGHVDHGKTTLLDAIRETRVWHGEAGGITQEVRAHVIEHNGQKITFIDTPGHEAFTCMRARGAEVTDIVLLVVAADDSVQPQTKECIDYAKKGKHPIIVAISKMDVEGAKKNIAKVKRELTAEGLQLEEYGGEVICVEVSAKEKRNLDKLLDSLLVVAELAEIKSQKPKHGIGEATVLESARSRSLGCVSLLVVRKGKFRQGGFLVYKDGFCRIRSLYDELQKEQPEVVEGMPTWISGLGETLETGDIVYFCESEKEAKEILKELKTKEDVAEQTETETEAAVSEEVNQESEEEEEAKELQELLARLSKSDEDESVKTLPILVKADAENSLEVIVDALKKIKVKGAKIEFLEKEAGEVTESDVLRAKNADGIVIGFRTNVPDEVKKIAQREKVLVRTYEIIYELLDEIAGALEGLLEPTEQEVVTGRAKVKKRFDLSDGTIVAGCEVTEKKIVKGNQIYVERGEERLGTGKVTSLKHEKEEIREAKLGTECGIIIEPQIEIEKGDEISAYRIEKVSAI